MEKNFRVLHTSNAGLLINIEENGLGIDMFSRDPEGIYPDTPEDIRQMLLDKIGQGRIQTLLFSHGHGDHFCLETVLEALKRNPQLEIISTEAVIRRIREREPRAGELYAIPPEEKENVKMKISGYRLGMPGFSLELFNAKHMGEQYANVQNLVCMIQANGKKLLVPGDAWPKPELFERVARWSPEVDLMAAPFPLIGIPTNRRMLNEALHIQNVLAFHLPRPEKDVQNWLENTKKVCSRAKDGLPAPVFGEELGKEYDF